MRIAIIGSGIAGLTCAHLLDRIHEVVLYEASDRLGGHANTVEVEDPTGGTLAVDTGFIVHNDRNYPNLVRLFDELGVATQESEMSFAVTDGQTGLCYRATSPNTVFADRRRLLDPSLWRMLADVARFYRAGRRMLAQVDDGEEGPLDLTIGDLLDHGRYGQLFVDAHLIPMGAAVWSASPRRFRDFPAVSLLRFLDNHGLLSIGRRPQWRTVGGGSRTYVAAIERQFGGKILRDSPVSAISRDADHVTVVSNASVETFDHVVVACHSDQALAVLDDPTWRECGDLGAIGYQPNEAVLHTDTSLLPPHRRAWAAWNYEVLPQVDRPTVTYDISLLMQLDGQDRYLVTLNGADRVDPSRVIAVFNYAHPVFDHDAVSAQRRIRSWNGQNRTSYCGAWMGYGFHEDGMSAALEVCRALGSTWPARP